MKDLLDQHFTNWQIEESGGEYRYQATPRGAIIGFYGYAASYEEAVSNIMRNASKATK